MPSEASKYIPFLDPNREGGKLTTEDIGTDTLLAVDIAPDAVDTEELKDGAVTKTKLKATSIQAGSASVSFPFAVAGVENVTATITFPTVFAVAPTTVIITCSVADINVAVTGITASDFTVTARDSEGTDYTAALSATIKWIAIE